MQVAVLGATGAVGSRVTTALEAAGASGVAVGHGAAPPAALEVPLLVAAGAGDDVRAAILAAVDAGRDVVDVDRDPGHLAWLHAHAAGQARPHGSRVVGGAGLRWGVGDLLVAVAASGLAEVEEVHVAYTAGGVRDPASAGERRARLAGLAVPAVVRLGGVTTEEPTGASRRLAWFPRPVGPSHAAGVPGGEVYSVPLHRPDAATIRTYEAVPGWRAEWLQAEANLAGSPWGRRLLDRRLARPRPVPGPADLAARRWGCVVEVTDGRTLVRAWAYGHDPVNVTAELGVFLSLRLAATRTAGAADGPKPGLLAASQLAPARAVLDHLAVRTDLRWSRSQVDLPIR